MTRPANRRQFLVTSSGWSGALGGRRTRSLADRSPNEKLNIGIIRCSRGARQHGNGGSDDIAAAVR